MAQYLYENPEELWRNIPGYPNYMISSEGRLYSKSRDTFIQPDKKGGVSLYNSEGQKGWSIQVLVGCVFLGNDINDPCRNRVLFKDGNSSNYKLSNLYIEDTSDLPGEEWKPLKEATGRELKDFYMVSNLGRIKSLKHFVEVQNHSKLTRKPCPEMMISCVPDADGYRFAYLACKNGSDVNAQVHRLVAAAFCPNDNPEVNIVVNHIDGDPSNNKAENLEWCTQAENTQHAIDTGLKGNWKGRKLRYVVIRKETNQLYPSVSDAERAMGRSQGYCSEQLSHGRILTDIHGEIWTLEIYKNVEHKVHTDGQHCTIDEFPGREFISLGEASIAIGRWEGYISDALKRGGVIKNKAGRIMHVHLIGDAPVVGANNVRAAKKAAGLLPEAKKRKTSEWAPRKALKHVETGEVYISMSDACRAMGRHLGYLNDCFSFDRPCVDANGVEWHFEFVEQDKSTTLHYRKNECFFDELPDKVFANMSEASLYIGRNGSYVNDRVRLAKPILTPEGKELHIHFADPAKQSKLESGELAVGADKDYSKSKQDNKAQKQIFKI